MLAAGEVHDITVWIENIYTVSEKKMKKVEVPNISDRPENIVFSVKSNENSKMILTAKAANLESGKKKCAEVFYKEHEGKESYKEAGSLQITSQEEQYTMEGTYQPGMVYDFAVVTNGAVQELQVQALGTQDIKLLKMQENTSAFGATRTFKVEGTGSLASEYYVYLYYYDGEDYVCLEDAVSLNAANGYEAKISTIDSWKPLCPDTEYDVKWVLSTSKGSRPAVIHAMYETFRTKSADYEVEFTKSYFNQQEFKIKLKEDSTSLGVSEFKLQNNIRKAGEKNYYRSEYYEFFKESEDFTCTVNLTGLEAETDYEFYLGIGSDKLITIFFTTPKDMMELEVNSVTTSMYNATLYCSLSGAASDTKGNIIVLAREKGKGNKWQLAYYTAISVFKKTLFINNIDNVSLKENTTYEYAVGISEHLDTRISQLKNVKTGEFKTKKDNRSLSGNKAVAGYRTAEIRAFFSGNTYANEQYITVFCRKKGDKKWKSVSQACLNDTESKQIKETIDLLEPGTKYEYAVAVTSSKLCISPDAITSEQKKVIGEFTTKQNEYNFDIELDADSIGHNKASVILTAKDSTTEESVKVTLILNDNQEETVVLKYSEDYKKKVTFTNLIENKEYEITNIIVEVIEGSSYIKIAEVPCGYKFTTKAVQIPSSIKLSEEEMVLNAAYTNSALDGINRKKLTAAAEPEGAEEDFIWRSDNEAVTVEKDGTVRAKSTGTSIITVESAYDETIKASCKVTVKNYIAGIAEEATGDITFFENNNNYCRLYKGETLEGIGLYEKDSDQKKTLLEEFTVTLQKSGIVSWEDGNLHALNTGNVKLLLEKDGIKALMNVTVSAEGKGFGITGFTASNKDYPAREEEDGSYTLAYVPGMTYKAEGEISPYQSFVPENFIWSISDTDMAQVDKKGVITPKKAGTVILKAVPAIFANTQEAYIQSEAEITLHIKNLPAEPEEEVLYALANTDSKIKNVKFPASWGEGWSWKYPETPLVTNGVNINSYPFEAVYSSTENYPCETVIQVYIGKISGASVTEISEKHNNVLEIGGKDFMTLEIKPVFQGTLSDAAYSVEVPEVKGLEIEKNTDNNTYKVTADKAGSYVLKPVIRADGKILAKTSFKIIAVKEKQAASIILTSDTEGVVIENNTILFESVEAGKNFTLKAEVKDRYGEPVETALTWKTADKGVANAAAESKKNTHTANVVIKGEGNTILTVTAKDKTGCKASLNVEIQNHAPRISSTKAEVNIAYDYNSYKGRENAMKTGGIEITPVYGKAVANVTLWKKDGKNKEVNLKISSYNQSENQYIVAPVVPEIPKGTYKCILRVETDDQTTYDYPITVNVINKAPSVSVKMSSSVNLFSSSSSAIIDLSISNNGIVDSVLWEDNSKGENGTFILHGSSTKQKNKYKSVITVSQQNIKVKAGKIADSSITKGTLRVMLKGYRKIYTYNNFKIKYNYKKPKLVIEDTGISTIQEGGENENYFCLYDKAEKKYLYYSTQSGNKHTFKEITCDNENMELYFLKSINTKEIKYQYCGTKKSEKIMLTVNSEDWKEAIRVEHKIKVIEPKVFFSQNQITFNALTKSEAKTSIYMKKGNTNTSVACADIVIKGADKKAAELLEKDLLIITSFNNTITVKYNQGDIMAETIPSGTYKYNVTPYCIEEGTGERKALKALALKVKIINQPIKASISPKGSLDLANGTNYSMKDKINTVVVNPVFRNLGTNYSVTDYKLTGEYSRYFKLKAESTTYGTKYGYYYFLTAADSGKLKAGQAYKLAIEYTLKAHDGKSFTVTSNTFTVKPKQSAPKITITSGNNQTLYISSDRTRTVMIAVPNSYYQIESAAGSLDCNKDGKADLTVSGKVEGTGEKAALKVEITDKNAVTASEKGKIYNIPVMVKLAGRDGVSRDAKITVKVTVRR